MRKLRRLKIHKYRDVEPGTELHFADGFNLLLGKNGSGKTTLLNLIAMIVSDDLTDIEDESFELEWEFVSGPHAAIAYVKHEVRPSPERASVRGRGHPEGVSHGSSVYRLLENGEEILKVARGQRTAVMEWADGASVDLMPHWENVAFEPDSPEGIVELLEGLLLDLDEEGLPAGLEGLAALEEAFEATNEWLFIVRFDEGHTWWAQALNLKVSLSGERGSQVLRGYYPLARIGYALRDKLMDGHSEPVLAAVGPSHLNAPVRWLGYKGLSVAVSLVGSSGTGEDRESTYSGPSYFVKDADRTLPATKLSWGEQRFLAFNLYLAAHKDGGILAIDELTNGMHPSMVEYCLDKLSGAQCFLATQSPSLIDHLKFESQRALQSSFVICQKDTSKQQGRMAWRNLREVEAEDMWKDYQIGLQRNHELLRGIW